MVRNLLLFLCCQSAFSQCDLQARNESFLIEIGDTKSINEKIDLIKQKLDTDSVYIENLKPKGRCLGLGNSTILKERCRDSIYSFEDVNEWKDTENNNCGKKLSFFIFYKKGKLMYRLPSAKKGNLILDRLSNENVNDIVIWDKDITSILGEKSQDIEAVVIYTDDRKIKDLIIQENKHDH